MRKLASIQRVLEISPIEGADAIELATVQGWRVVVKKNSVFVGELVCYIEIDGWIPNHLCPFLSKGREPREYNGVKGERLRTVRLRGALSQGLIIPLVDLEQYSDSIVLEEGFDLTEILGIQKLEPEIPASLAGMIRGQFPSFGFKTDETRIQTCYNSVSRFLDSDWVGEEKLDGSSCSIIQYDGDQHVCSRNLSIQLTDESNSFVQTVKKAGILEAMRVVGGNFQISGELCGPGIQSNRYSLKEHKVFVFEVFDLNAGKKLSRYDRTDYLNQLRDQGAVIEEVPQVFVGKLTGMTCDDLLRMAEDKSVLNPKTEREGLVFKSVVNPNVTFKAISNLFLLKGGD